MARIVLTDGSGRFFNSSKATVFEENTRWDGRNHVSLATGTQFEHETLYLTKSGNWFLYSWSQWQGSTPSCEEVDAAFAAGWMSRNGIDPPSELMNDYKELCMD